jgi:hypothetical protein
MINSRSTTIVTKLNEVYPIQQKDVACGCPTYMNLALLFNKAYKVVKNSNAKLSVLLLKLLDRTVHQNIFIQISNRIIECLSVSYVKYVRKYL